MRGSERKSGMSLSKKLNLLIISLILVTSLGITFFNIQREIKDDYQNLLEHGRTVADMVSKNCEYGIYTENREFLLNVVKNLEVDPDIAYVAILNKEKRELVRQTFRSSARTSTESRSMNFESSNQSSYTEILSQKDGKHYIEILTPVLSVAAVDPFDPLFREEIPANQQRVIGYVQLGLTLEQLRMNIRRFLFATLLFTSLSVLLGIAFTLIITKRITSPIKKLKTATQDIAEGRLDHQIEITGSDEISDLSASFNHMLGRLRDYRREVGERTSELKAANELLLDEIGERKKAEEALRQTEQRFRNLVETTSDWVWEVDEHAVYTYVSPKILGILGYTPEELIGKTPFDFMPAEEATRVREIFEPLSASHQPFMCLQNINLHKGGHLVMLETSGAPFFDREGRFSGYRGIDRDVTERIKMEKELIKFIKLESIGILAGGLAHDFNNLLTGILGNISLAKTLLNPEDKAYERLTRAEKASMRAKDLTYQLLAFSKGGEPVKKTTSLAELLHEASSFILSGSNIRCDIFSLPDDLSLVEVDEGQMSQVFNNIVINAREAMSEGGLIRMGAENITVGPNDNLPLKEGEYIKVSISDQGSGIPEKNLPKIFDPFYSTKEKGSGLGLASAYSIIKRHDGYIDVESTVGVGTTFHIYLPASKSKHIETRHPEEKIPAAKGKILVMDDEEIVRDIAGEMLRHMGYEVEFARDGLEAIASYKGARESGTPFDVVIIDLTIPGGMGGKETIRNLTDIDSDVRAIVSSGYSNDPIMSNFRKYGFAGVVTKPYKIEELGEAIWSVRRKR